MNILDRFDTPADEAQQMDDVAPHLGCPLTPRGEPRHVPELRYWQASLSGRSNLHAKEDVRGCHRAVDFLAPAMGGREMSV